MIMICDFSDIFSSASISLFCARGCKNVSGSSMKNSIGLETPSLSVEEISAYT